MSVDLVIRIKNVQLKSLIEKLQAAKLDLLFWENHCQEIRKKKEALESEIREMRVSSLLKYAKMYDEHLLFLEERLENSKKDYEKSFLKFQTIQMAMHALLQDRKKFEKLQKKRREYI